MRTLFVILSRRHRGILHLADSVFSALEMFACPRYLCTVHIETIGKISVSSLIKIDSQLIDI